MAGIFTTGHPVFVILEDFLRFLEVFMGFLEVEPEIFRTFLAKFRKDF